MRKWLKPGCPYFRSDSWSTESLNRNVTTRCDGTVSRRPRIRHRDHWRTYSLCRIRYDCLKIVEHELTRCHDGLTNDYHGASRWYCGCTSFRLLGWLGLFVFYLKAQETGGHRCDHPYKGLYVIQARSYLYAKVHSCVYSHCQRIFKHFKMLQSAIKW